MVGLEAGLNVQVEIERVKERQGEREIGDAEIQGQTERQKEGGMKDEGGKEGGIKYSTSGLIVGHKNKNKK